MQPRIYTYKIRFEEIPDWYWGVHKENKYKEFYMGSPKTHAWKWDTYTPYLEVCEVFPYTDEGWEEACKVEKRCIKPDLNNPLCLNENAGGFMSLNACRVGGTISAKRSHEEKDEFGRSITAVKGGKAAQEKLGEKILVTFPDGYQRLFSSIRKTSRFFNVTAMAIIYHIKKGSSTHGRKLSGYRFEIAEEM
jgi:hypothetical protein